MYRDWITSKWLNPKEITLLERWLRRKCHLCCDYSMKSIDQEEYIFLSVKLSVRMSKYLVILSFFDAHGRLIILLVVTALGNDGLGEQTMFDLIFGENNVNFLQSLSRCLNAELANVESNFTELFGLPLGMRSIRKRWPRSMKEPSISKSSNQHSGGQFHLQRRWWRKIAIRQKLQRQRRRDGV